MVEKLERHDRIVAPDALGHVKYHGGHALLPWLLDDARVHPRLPSPIISGRLARGILALCGDLWVCGTPPSIPRSLLQWHLRQLGLGLCSLGRVAGPTLGSRLCGRRRCSMWLCGLLPCRLWLCGLRRCGLWLCGLWLCGLWCCRLWPCGLWGCGLGLCGLRLCGLRLCGLGSLDRGGHGGHARGLDRLLGSLPGLVVALTSDAL
mmetsp:Transcript_53516/g.142638  ORF Transcript_53516/g.142638 Transcript_53516/m.142638 type:complete len:205 (+) Transcript_53516:1134-1748(+)